MQSVFFEAVYCIAYLSDERICILSQTHGGDGALDHPTKVLPIPVKSGAKFVL